MHINYVEVTMYIDAVNNQFSDKIILDEINFNKLTVHYLKTRCS